MDIDLAKLKDIAMEASKWPKNTIWWAEHFPPAVALELIADNEALAAKLELDGQTINAMIEESQKHDNDLQKLAVKLELARKESYERYIKFTEIRAKLEAFKAELLKVANEGRQTADFLRKVVEMGVKLEAKLNGAEAVLREYEKLCNCQSGFPEEPLVLGYEKSSHFDWCIGNDARVYFTSSKKLQTSSELIADLGRIPKEPTK